MARPEADTDKNLEITITPSMIAAGVAILADKYGVVSEWAAEELAEEVFRAMAKVATIAPDGRDSN